MSKAKSTSIVLPDNVKKLKDELAPVYGLKNILSAGLVLFGRLSADEREKIIADLSSDTVEQSDMEPSRMIMQIFEKLAPELKPSQIKLLSQSECDMIKKLIADHKFDVANKISQKSKTG